MGIIIKPLVTEKMTAITEKLNRFGFIVRPEANKLEIKSEIEALYNVTVVDVNTLKYSGKSKSRYTKSGIINGRTNAYKKAIVTLKEGDTIDVEVNAKITHNGKAYPIASLPDNLVDILNAGGLVKAMRKLNGLD